MRPVARGLAAFFILSSLSGCQLNPAGDHYITTPYDQQSVSGVFTILVTPPDDYVTDSVRFFINSNFVTEDFTSPYSYEWNTRLNTNAACLIEVEIYNQMGGVLTDAITVYVRN